MKKISLLLDFKRRQRSSHRAILLEDGLRAIGLCMCPTKFTDTLMCFQLLLLISS